MAAFFIYLYIIFSSYSPGLAWLVQILLGYAPGPGYVGPNIARYLTLMGLNTLQVIIGDLTISSQTSYATTLYVTGAFPQLKFILGTLGIRRDIASTIPVIGFFGLPALKQVSTNVEIVNQGFQNMLSLNNLTCVGNTTALVNNTQLTSLAGFEKMQTFNYRGDDQGLTNINGSSLIGKPHSGKTPPTRCWILCSKPRLPALNPSTLLWKLYRSVHV